MLYKMVEVGDVVQMSDGGIHKITHIVDGVAFYSRKYKDHNGNLINDCFIAKFNTNGSGVTTYNNLVTLIDKA